MRAQLVGGLAREESVLPLLGGDDAQRGVRELVRGGEDGDLVVLVVVELLAVLDPHDGGGGEGLHVALQDLVVLQGLAVPRALDRHKGTDCKKTYRVYIDFQKYILFIKYTFKGSFGENLRRSVL